MSLYILFYNRKKYFQMFCLPVFNQGIANEEPTKLIQKCIYGNLVFQTKTFLHDLYISTCLTNYFKNHYIAIIRHNWTLQRFPRNVGVTIEN